MVATPSILTALPQVASVAACSCLSARTGTCGDILRAGNLQQPHAYVLNILLAYFAAGATWVPAMGHGGRVLERLPRTGVLPEPETSFFNRKLQNTQPLA